KQVKIVKAKTIKQTAEISRAWCDFLIVGICRIWQTINSLGAKALSYIYILEFRLFDCLIILPILYKII
ncbi:MAG: hypothetical protein LBC33_03170, partial [Mycoplasmataceae bacterium]|nr:hypothetical protein [Mycoplasmataceae bacterium]